MIYTVCHEADLLDCSSVRQFKAHGSVSALACKSWREAFQCDSELWNGVASTGSIKRERRAPRHRNGLQADWVLIGEVNNEWVHCLNTGMYMPSAHRSVPPPPIWKPNTSNYEGSQRNHIHLGLAQEIPVGLLKYFFQVLCMHSMYYNLLCVMRMYLSSSTNHSGLQWDHLGKFL